MRLNFTFVSHANTFNQNKDINIDSISTESFNNIWF